jgi:hypothetical protein
LTRLRFYAPLRSSFGLNFGTKRLDTWAKGLPSRFFFHGSYGPNGPKNSNFCNQYQLRIQNSNARGPNSGSNWPYYWESVEEDAPDCAMKNDCIAGVQGLNFGDHRRRPKGHDPMHLGDPSGEPYLRIH